MSDNKYNPLKLENQLCFPLYVCSKEVIRRYKPFLDPLDLTYTQYIVMMVMWEKKQVTVSELGSELYLDSGTLTPLLKKMEQKGLVTRRRMETDERSVCVAITEKGEALKDEAVSIPQKLGGCLPLSREDAVDLHRILRKIMSDF